MRYPSLHSSVAGGAGYLSPLPGSLLDILDAVLVDGYNRGGSAISPLGWSKPFARLSNECTYRPPIGTSLIFKVSDNLAAVSHLVAAITAYESMSDLYTGFGAWGGMFLGKCSGVDVMDALKYSPAWWIIGDGKGFYLVIGDHDAYLTDPARGVPVVIQYVGDFDSLAAGDSYNCLVAGHTNPSLLSSVSDYCFFKSWGSFGYTSTGKVYSAPTGGALGLDVGLVEPEGGRGIGGNTSMLNPASLSVGSIIPRLTPVLFTGASGPRGKMPGLFSVYPNIEGKTGDTFLDAAGNSFMLLNVEFPAGQWEQYALQLNAW